MPDSASAATPAAEEPKTNLHPLDALPYLLDTTIMRWNQRLGRRLAPFGLTFEKWRVLLVTSRGPMNIRELSNATLVPHSTIGRWLTQMEDEGLVRRRVLPRDQRAVEISITQKGRGLFMRVLPTARLEYEWAVQEFTPEELETLMAYLSRLRSNLIKKDMEEA